MKQCNATTVRERWEGVGWREGRRGRREVRGGRVWVEGEGREGVGGGRWEGGCGMEGG